MIERGTYVKTENMDVKTIPVDPDGRNESCRNAQIIAYPEASDIVTFGRQTGPLP